LKKELRIHADYRQKTEFDLRTLGEEFDKLRHERNADDVREIESLKGTIKDLKY
jgi:hypothetical protein